MMKKGLSIINGMIGAFTGIFIGHAIYLYRNIEFYKSRSIPWHEDLSYWGMIWLIEILVCMLIKYKININYNIKMHIFSKIKMYSFSNN